MKNIASKREGIWKKWISVSYKNMCHVIYSDIKNKFLNSIFQTNVARLIWIRYHFVDNGIYQGLFVKMIWYSCIHVRLTNTDITMNISTILGCLSRTKTSIIKNHHSKHPTIPIPDDIDTIRTEQCYM